MNSNEKEISQGHCSLKRMERSNDSHSGTPDRIVPREYKHGLMNEGSLAKRAAHERLAHLFRE
jgi:hypothetical protein